MPVVRLLGAGIVILQPMVDALSQSLVVGLRSAKAAASEKIIDLKEKRCLGISHRWIAAEEKIETGQVDAGLKTERGCGEFGRRDQVLIAGSVNRAQDSDGIPLVDR